MNDITKKLKEYFLTMTDKEGRYKDPNTGLFRPRSACEIIKSLDFPKKTEKTMKWILKSQNPNGSWNEIHPDLDEESCVETAVVGDMISELYFKIKSNLLRTNILKAGNYILSKEFSPGYFIKSYRHYADVLNVNATCASFLYKLYLITKNKKYLEARDRAIFNVVRYQFKDGAYPYSSETRTFPYEWGLDVKDIHYHALTLYFLLKSDPELKNRYLKISAEKAVKWLAESLSKDSFKWEKSNLIFSIGVTGAYGYAAYCFNKMKFRNEFETCIRILRKIQNDDGSFNRFHKGSFSQSTKNILSEITNDEFTFRQKLVRMKRKFKRNFIERNKIVKDLYYTSQIFECLSSI
ncbi:MAG: prenyltransferase/squalene oxidase repeat-containing protein [Candidatus Nanoarchaeia archaeon]|nr:prenyltransferase/squalene oxidase repeat-containing protein [Candidatus Nanoarchaeia archaeon]